MEPYGRTKAKIDLSVLDRLAGTLRREARLRHRDHADQGRRGEDGDGGLARAGPRTCRSEPVLCLREASLGPVFGIKGGAAGGGYAQVVPMEDLNLHFTGDIHAIGAANNLLAAMIEAHLLHGNPLGLDPLTIGWRRCVDVNDRALRTTVVGLGGRANGYPRETGFDITAASEVMAIVAVARDLGDLRDRVGAITVGYTYEGEPVLAEQLRAAGAMTVLLKDAIKPNLVQTLEGSTRAGPLRAVREHRARQQLPRRRSSGVEARRLRRHGVRLRLGHGHGEVPQHRLPGRRRTAECRRSRRHRKGAEAPRRRAGRRARRDRARLSEPRTAPEEHRGVRAEGRRRRQPLPGRHGGRKVALVRRLALEYGAHAAEPNEAFERGGVGAAGLAEAVADAAEQPNSFRFTYALDEPIDAKIEALVRQVYRADGAVFLQTAKDKIARYTRDGLDRLPICMAKTHLSLSHDPALDERADRLRGDRAGPSRVHRGRLARRALRDDADDARARRLARGVQRRHRRGWAHGWALLASSTRASRSSSTRFPAADAGAGGRRRCGRRPLARRGSDRDGGAIRPRRLGAPGRDRRPRRGVTSPCRASGRRRRGGVRHVHGRAGPTRTSSGSSRFRSSWRSRGGGGRAGRGGCRRGKPQRQR